jgi:DNA-binding transcriptional MerR regulator
MFKIGDFSKVAQVSGRLLRYYDEIDIFKPIHIDRATGYRYYTAEQLPSLNRILALKNLGLSLDQVAQMIQDNISTEEMRGMLLLKKSQIEQNLREEFFRLQAVESRLRQIDQAGSWSDLPVAIKDIPPQPFLSSRKRDMGSGGFNKFYVEVMHALSSNQTKTYGTCICVTHNDMMEDHFDLELGFVVQDNTTTALALPNYPDMEMGILEGAQMATLVHVGNWTTGLESYQALGTWVEQSRFCIVGSGREVFIEVKIGDYSDDNIYEIQFPIEPAESLLK